MWVGITPSAQAPSYTIGLPGSLGSRQQIVGLLILHNHVAQSLCLFVYLSVYHLCPAGSVSLENSSSPNTVDKLRHFITRTHCQMLRTNKMIVYDTKI